MNIVLQRRTTTAAVVSANEHALLEGVSLRDYPMLGHVDGYGTTVFNRSQMRSLADEIEQLTAARVLNSEQERVFPEIAELCRQGQRPPHQQLSFHGG